MTERDEDAVARFIERFALKLTQLGFQRMAARVFVALLVSESGTLTAAELAGRLQVSPAAVSGAVRYLSQLDLARKEREPGSRVDHHVVRDDVWEHVVGRRDQVVGELTGYFADGADVLGKDTAAGARMADARLFFEFLGKEFGPLMERWREYRQSLP